MSQKYFLLTVMTITLVVFFIMNAFLTENNEITVVISACGLALVHVLSGFYMTRWAFNKSMKLFLSIVMGGMGIRMLLVGILIVILVKVVDIDIKLFIVTFGIYYLLFQMVELYFINRGLQLKKVMKS
ncbi:hypothetical protein F9K33_02430 [bacterium]|nr:MAG: hypothetical protein F9K33_02430 [bacterium]